MFVLRILIYWDRMRKKLIYLFLCIWFIYLEQKLFVNKLLKKDRIDWNVLTNHRPDMHTKHTLTHVLMPNKAITKNSGFF